MVVRDALLSDAEAISGILGAYIPTLLSYEISTPSREKVQDLIRTVNQDGLPFLVVEDGDTVVGFSYVKRFGHNRVDTCFRFSGVLDTWIALDHLDQTHGRFLQQAILYRLQSARIRIVCLYTTRQKRGLLTAFGLDFPGLVNNGYLPAITRKNGEPVDINISQFDTGNYPSL